MKGKKPSKIRHLVWLGVVSLLLGTIAALMYDENAVDLGDFGPSTFEYFSVFYKIAFFTGIIFIVALFALKLCCWLFCWRNIKRCFIGVALLAILAVLFYIEEDWRGKWAWEKYKHELEAKGERFNFASFIPPQVPDDQNFAFAPIVASCYQQYLDKNGREIIPPNTNLVNRLEMHLMHLSSAWKQPKTDATGNWQIGLKTNLKGWQAYYRSPADTNYSEMHTNEYPVALQAQSPAIDVLLALSKYDSAIEELREASRLRYARFPYQYDKEPYFDIELWHVDAVKQCAKVLSLRAIAELEAGQSEKALADVQLIFYLTHSIQNEPVNMTQYLRLLIINYAIEAIWEGITEHKWSDAELITISAELARFTLLSDYQFTVRARCATGIKFLEYIAKMRNLDFFTGEFFDTREEAEYPRWGARMLGRAFIESIPRGWFYQNEISAAKLTQQYLLTDEEIRQNIIPSEVGIRSDNGYEDLRRHFSPYSFCLWMLEGGGSLPAKRYAYSQCSVDLTRVACALERYRIANGEYPESLETLSPNYLFVIPHDIANGQPLHYHRTTDGRFVLYSIGWKGKDTGGSVVLREFSNNSIDLDKSDWVWMFPKD